MRMGKGQVRPDLGQEDFDGPLADARDRL